MRSLTENKPVDRDVQKNDDISGRKLWHLRKPLGPGHRYASLDRGDAKEPFRKGGVRTRRHGL